MAGAEEDDVVGLEFGEDVGLGIVVDFDNRQLLYLLELLGSNNDK